MSPEKQVQKYQSRDWYIPVVQALAPFSPGGCRAVIGLVPRASLTGNLYFSICERILLRIISPESVVKFITTHLCVSPLNYGPAFRQTVQGPGGIGRAGGRETDGFPPHNRKEIPVIQLKGGFPVAEYLPDLCSAQDDGDVVRFYIPDAAVRGAGDPA